MKIKKYILFVILSLAAFVPLLAQSDTLGIVQIYNTTLAKPDSLYFELRFIRLSNLWDKFANATFVIDFADTNFLINPDSLNIAMLDGTSELKLYTQTGGQELPTFDYLITPRVFPDRFSVTIAGPELYPDAKFSPKDSFFVIGKFVVTPKNSSTILPDSLVWKKPFYYYQACAYKIDRDSVLAASYLWAQTNDNIEMFDANNLNLKFDVDRDIEPVCQVLDFKTEYRGRRKVELSWRTTCEKNNKGFILHRAMMTYDVQDTNTDVTWTEIARWDGPRDLDEVLIGLGTSNPGKGYLYQFDTVPYRGFDYCYRLYSQDFHDSVHFVAQSCVPAPHAVITYAQANPNPFSSSTTIKYRLDDDVYLDCIVYDLAGKELMKLIDNVEKKVGEHEVVFNAPQLATEGMYQVVFFGHPIDDPMVELSRAVVKVQLMR